MKWIERYELSIDNYDNLREEGWILHPTIYYIQTDIDGCDIEKEVNPHLYYKKLVK